MTDQRPNPDELLARVQAEEARGRRGKLRIFFGYAAGVGKTYAMLEAARRERADGVDVVVGYVEPHGRPETEALLVGLEAVPPRVVPYRGVTLREFDLDAALARRPRLILVDELAHTNADGSRHAKRWQDVEELRDAGIDVWTTLNVQHVESLNDVIAQITGVVVRETLPDAVLEGADEIELTDLTPEELIERLREGKVYVAPQAERALRNFFQAGNLTALRELALRQAADRLRRDVDEARRARAATAPWATGERLLVCVGPSPTSTKLLRAAKRMAAAFGAEWWAVAVDTGGQTPAAAAARAQVARHLRFAESLGAETQTLVGGDVARAVLDFARAGNVTKIVVGKTALPWWRRAFVGTVVDDLLEQSGDIDVYVIRGEGEARRPAPPPPAPAPVAWDRYARTAGVVAACGLIGWACSALGLSEANTVMVFLLGVVFAARYGRGPAVAAAVAGVLLFDFFFVPPHGSFAVSDTQYVVTFAVMLFIGVLISTLTARVQDRLRRSQDHERRTAALYRFARQLSQIAGEDFLVQAAGRQLAEIFGGEVVLYLRAPGGPVGARYGAETTVARHPASTAVAQWVADHDQPAGAGTDTLPDAVATFAPMTGAQWTVGAVGVRPADPQLLLDPEERRSLEACAGLIALAVERDRSVLEAQQAQVRIQAEQLRNSLLSSVSHDLRTPLAAIAGAATGLLDGADRADAATRRELLQTVADEARRMARLVDNLLDMTRLESGAVAPNKQWHVLEEVVGSALARARTDLAGHAVAADVPADLPLVSLDGVLFEQALVHLLENAARHTPAGSRVEVSARVTDGGVEVRVADTGPGLPPGGEAHLFEKFYRGTAAPDGRRGVGLGLAICRAIVQAHGGRVAARNRPGGGAEFVITLPRDEAAPRVVPDEAPAGAEA
jgi:two-component system sensor histidine kinase KdpD